MRPRAGWAIVAALMLLVSCGGDSGTSASGGVSFVLVVTADGPFSIKFNGDTITAQGTYSYQLKPGTYELTGQMNTYVLGIDFSKISGTGGVQAGSVKSLAGPAVDVHRCGALYLTYGPPSSVRVQFAVTEAEGAACKT